MNQRAAPRLAFTLIEVLIALGLSVLLISAIYGAVDMHYRYQSAGRAEIRGQQLVRSLTRLISQDVACIVQPLPEETASTSTGQAADENSLMGSSSSTSSSTSSSSSASTSSNNTSSPATSSSATSPAGASTSFQGLKEGGLPIPFGVVGTADLLHLTVQLPSREMQYVQLGMEATPEERSSDLQIVTIGLTDIDSLSMSMLQKNLKTTRPGRGLGRRLRSLYTTIAGDEALEPQHLIAPEVTELSFRYFDSGEWFDNWDSTTMGRLPRAIEVTFGFWNPPPVQVGRNSGTGPGTVTNVVYVFKVPLSVPSVE